MERQSNEQRLTNVANQLEIDKLTFARVTGLAMDQQFELAEQPSPIRFAEMTLEGATGEALRGRADLSSAEAAARAAESTLRAEKAKRLPTLSLDANYGGGGRNVGGLNEVYQIAGTISVPLYTGGRISADIGQAQADLERRRAEYEDLRGRIAYDVRVAWLNVSASNSSVQVAGKNRGLADRALTQSQDRYINGVTNYLEVVQAQETVAAANENYIQSLYSLNIATISMARAMGARPRPDCKEGNNMTEELELERTVPAESPKPKLVDPKPAGHNTPTRSKRRISRWLVAFTILAVTAGGARLWLQSRGFESTDDAQVDVAISTRSAPASAAL